MKAGFQENVVRGIQNFQHSPDTAMRTIVTILFIASLLAAQSGKQNRAHHQATAKQASAKDQPTDTQTPAASVPQGQVPNAQIHSEPPCNVSAQPEGKSKESPKTTDWIMVGLTAAYAFISLLLFFAVKRQADISETAANAALLSAQSFIDSQRAHLLTFVVDGSMVQTTGGSHGNTCRVTFKNFGISPGWITQAEGSFQWIKNIEELSPHPQYGTVNFESHGPVLPDGESDSMIIRNQIASGFSNELWPDYRLAVFGAIKYRDRFRSDYNLKFCFISAKGNTFFFEQSGPAAYNTET